MLKHIHSPKNSTSSPREKKHYALDVFCISVLYLFVSLFCTFLYLRLIPFFISQSCTFLYLRLVLFYISVLYLFVSSNYPNGLFLRVHWHQIVTHSGSFRNPFITFLLRKFFPPRFQRSLNINCGKILTVQCESVDPTPKRRNKDKWNCKQAERCWYFYCVETFLVVVGIFRMGRSVPEHLLCLWKTFPGRVCP